MIPQTRYADGPCGALAYQVLGDGPPDLVMVPGWTSHLELQWQMATYRTFMRKLARYCRLVRYDKLGTGLSDPTPGAPTTDERVADLHAVVQAAGSPSPVVMGFSEGGPLSIRYALNHPVRALILYGTAMRPPPPEHAGVLEELLNHWGEGRSLDVFAPSSAADPVARDATAAMERAGASPAMIRHVMAAVSLADAGPALASLTVPTLVVHRSDELIPLAEAEALAGSITGARLVVLPGVDHHPWAGHHDGIIEAIAAFLEQVSPPAAGESGGHRPTGHRPRTGPNALTEAERRVAAQAAAGSSNPQIARDLHMARTTVETHLKRVYLKLGIDGRHQLSGLDGG
ncbi:MAG: alpha/beta fold hydrolase [Jatrophihabitans sp.]|uniref:alpha/beta fold hydrolase n=1 Tax=Jatrophihabitans sp. TaxID=1932789 RepID=UPI003912067A